MVVAVWANNGMSHAAQRLALMQRGLLVRTGCCIQYALAELEAGNGCRHIRAAAVRSVVLECPRERPLADIFCVAPPSLQLELNSRER